MKTSSSWSTVFLFLSLLLLSVPTQAEEFPGPSLFPVNGVTLGKTTIDELLDPEAVELEEELETDGFLRLGSLELGYEERIITTLELYKGEPMPVIWADAGFEWSLSYNSWVSLLEELGFSINSIQVPTLQMKADHPVMDSQFEAFRPGEYPTVFTFYFTENQGTGVTSENVLYKISARYFRDFKGFAHEDQFEDQEPVILDEPKRKALALSGITAAINSLNHETLELTAINQESIAYWKKVLMEDWGIANRKQLLEKLTSLESKGDSEIYQNLVNILNQNQELTINRVGKQFNYEPGIINRLYFVKEKQGIIGDRALRAWDYSRLAFLCRIGYQVGFLTSNEAWICLKRVLTKVENFYQSWEDYAANYLLGMMFQAAESGRESEVGNRGLEAYARLISCKGSAWQLEWVRKDTDTANQAIGNTLPDVLYFPSVQYQAWTNYLNGWQSYENGELTEALNYFKNGLTLDPEFVDLWLTIAMVYNMQNDFEKAIEAFTEYLTKNPGEYLPRIYLAEVYEKNNQFVEALAEYNKAIDLDDSRPEGFVGLGRVAINAGDYQLAVSYLRIAETLSNSEGYELYYTLYLLGYSYYKDEKFDKALSYFLRAYSNFQDNMYVNYYLGVCYLYNQNTQLASVYLERAEALGLVIPPELKSILDQTNKSQRNQINCATISNLPSSKTSPSGIW